MLHLPGSRGALHRQHWTAMADRRPAPPRNPRSDAKEVRLVPLGAVDGSVKTAIFGGNNARLYDIQPRRAMLELKGDRFSMMKTEYEKAGPEPSHTRYGYVVPNGEID